MKLKQSTIDFMVKRYGIKPEECVWFHSGICYSTARVNTKDAAEVISKKVEGQTVNGGMFDGSALGVIHENKDGTFDVRV